MDPCNHLTKSHSHPSIESTSTTPSLGTGYFNPNLTELFNSTVVEFTNNLQPKLSDSTDYSKKRKEPSDLTEMPNVKKRKLEQLDALEQPDTEEFFSLFEGDLGKELLRYCSSSTPPPLDQSSSSIVTTPATISLLPEPGLPELAKLVDKPNSSTQRQHQPQDSFHRPNSINARSHLPLRTESPSVSQLSSKPSSVPLLGPEPIRVKVYRVDEPISTPGSLDTSPKQTIINYEKFRWSKGEDGLLLKMKKENYDFQSISEAITAKFKIYRSSGACHGRLELLKKKFPLR